jgi:hypothetical protein
VQRNFCLIRSIGSPPPQKSLTADHAKWLRKFCNNFLGPCSSAQVYEKFLSFLHRKKYKHLLRYEIDLGGGVVVVKARAYLRQVGQKCPGRRAFLPFRLVKLLAEFDPVPRDLSALPMPDHGFEPLRSFLVQAIVLIAALWAVDVAMLDGRNSRAIWQQFNDQGQNFSYDVQQRLKRALLGH